MFKLARILLWLLIFLVAAAGLDQFLLRVQVETPGLHQVQQFYVDFRSRLLDLVGTGHQGQSIEQVIEATAVPKSDPVEKKHRYLYVDKDGDLQFADSLEQVPSRYRKDAQPLAQ